MQQFVSIGSGEKLTDSRQEIVNNDLTVMSCNSGTSFPTTNLEVGMFCFRTDLNQLFQLEDLTPTWKMVFDLSKTATDKEYVDAQDAAKVNTSDVVAVAAANKILRLDGNGKLPASITGDAATVGGAPPAASAAASALVVRDSSGNIFGVYFNSSRPNEDGTVAASYVFDSGDGYMRKKSVAAMKTELGITAAPAVESSIPMWMRDFGDGVDGAFSSTGNFSASGEYRYTDFTLNAGHTLSVSPFVIIRCSGTCTIAGTISAVGVGGGGGRAGTSDNTSGGQGGSGTGGASGGTGATNGGGSYPGGPGGYSYFQGTGYYCVAGPGATPSSQAIKLMASFAPIALGAGGGGGASGITNGGVGGAGGGCVIIVARNVNFTGTINVSGANGGSTGNAGGGAGGGGGSVIRAAKSFIADTGTINVSGGGGGGGARTGGSGAAGWSMKYTIL